MPLLHREAIIDYLAEIAMGDLSLTLAKIEEEPDHATRELLFGLLCLHEDLVLQRQEVASLNTFLENILQSFSELLFIVNDSGQIQMLNKQSILSIGLSSDDIMHRSLLNFLEPTAEVKWSQELFSSDTFPFARIVELIQNKHFIEVPMTLKGQDQDFPVLVTGHLMKKLPNIESSLIFSAKDGRQSRLLKELQEKQQQLVQASKLASMGELSSGIAHELNNPLFAISGLTEVMQLRLKTQHPEAYASVEKSIETMLLATDKMRKIINHIRIFARQEEMQFAWHPINEIIQSGLLLIHEQLRMRNIVVDLRLSEDNPSLFCAHNRLEQIILNLFSNARDAIETRQETDSSHQGHILVETRVQKGFVEVYFKDNGVGIPQETIEKIYDPFFSTKDVGKGTGLGLSISYGILQEHNATVEVDSVVNRHTAFTLRFPLDGSAS